MINYQFYKTAIDEIWQDREYSIDKFLANKEENIDLINQVIDLLDQGQISVVQKDSGLWIVNEWIKKAILLNFSLSDARIYDGGCQKWYDKIDPKFYEAKEQDFKNNSCRVVPGAFIRKGAYIGSNTVIMPSFINVGSYVGSGSLIDTWATVGSCAYIGKNCHISGGAGIGGVLEPLQASPVIIEDNCFIGARSEIVEGVVVGEGSVISMGVFIGASTKIIDRKTGEITYGKVPPYSVVVSGTIPPNVSSFNEGNNLSNKLLPHLYCAVIVKRVDEKTRSKTSINELLRD